MNRTKVAIIGAGYSSDIHLESYHRFIPEAEVVAVYARTIDKAKAFGFDVNGAVMASDAFFPFPDCVEIAHLAGITSVVQPGGSIRDKDSTAYCNANGISMVTTGIRHFKH